MNRKKKTGGTDSINVNRTPITLVDLATMMEITVITKAASAGAKVRSAKTTAIRIITGITPSTPTLINLLLK